VGLLDRFRKRAAASAPANSLSESAAELVRIEAARLIRPGFRTRAEVHAEVVGLIEDDVIDIPGGVETLSTEEIEKIVDDAWSERLRAEQSWVGLSDSDRLASAFAELEAEGIVARMNFTCCGTCGHAEIGEEVAEDESARGYVFFHMQDADGLVEGDAPSLYFDYGAWTGEGAPFPDDESYAAAAVAIGHEVVRALEGCVPDLV
jgi:hypothetical protein